MRTDNAPTHTVAVLRSLSLVTALPVVAIILLYQVLVSRRLPRVCVYEPSCSEYTRLALLRFGFIRGIHIAWNRIRRCQGGEFHGVDLPPLREEHTAPR